MSCKKANKDNYYEHNNNQQYEYKKPKTHISDKEGAKNIPSWVEGNKSYKNESGKLFAKRLMDQRYGKGNYKTGVNSDYNKIKKRGDRAFE